MSELIDRKRFSADMRDFQNRVGIWRDEAEDTETRTRAYAALATIIETKLILDKQPTVAAASPWHRVEDELPPKATWVLTIATDENVKIFNIATVDAGGQWWTYSPQNILRELYGVRYWMPIEPPKEEEHGN